MILDDPVPPEYVIKIENYQEAAAMVQEDRSSPPLLTTYMYSNDNCSDEALHDPMDHTMHIYLPDEDECLPDEKDCLPDEDDCLPDEDDCLPDEEHQVGCCKDETACSVVEGHSISTSPTELQTIPVAPGISNSMPISSDCPSVLFASSKSLSEPVSLDSYSVPSTPDSCSVPITLLNSCFISSTYPESCSIPSTRLESSSVPVAPLDIQVDGATCSGPAVPSISGDVNQSGSTESSKPQCASLSGQEDIAQVSLRVGIEQDGIITNNILVGYGNGSDSSSLSDSDWLNENILPRM